VLVQRQLVAQPLRVGDRADEDEQRLRRQPVPHPGAGVLGDHRLQMPVPPLHPAHLRVQPHVDVRRPTHPVDQVAGHVPAEVAAAYEQVHPGRPGGQEDCRLAGGVAAADHDDRIGDAGQRLHLGGRVEHADPLVVLQVRHVQPAVANPGGDQDGPPDQLGAVVQPDHVAAVVGLLQRGRPGRHAEHRAEFPGLDDRPVGQVGAGDAGGEAEVVLDPGRGAGLPAGGDRVDRQGLQPFGGAVDRGGQAGRARADDEQVAGRVRWDRGAQPDRLSQLGVRGFAQHLVAAPDHHLGLLRLDAEAAYELVRLGVGLQVDPPVRQPVARGELAQPPGVGRVARADDPQPRAELDVQRAADQQRPQDQVAQLRVVDDEPAQQVDRDHEHLAGLAGDGGDRDRPPGHLPQLADEAVRAVDRQQAGVRPGAVEHRHRPGQHHHQVGIDVAGPEQHLVRLDRPGPPAALQRADLLGRQPGVRAVQVRRLGKLDLVTTCHGPQIARSRPGNPPRLARTRPPGGRHVGPARRRGGPAPGHGPPGAAAHDRGLRGLPARRLPVGCTCGCA